MAKAKSAIVSIIVATLALPFAAQASGALCILLEALLYRPLSPDNSPKLLIFSIVATTLAGVILGAWMQSRHRHAAWIALPAALLGVTLNAALNFVGGGAYLDPIAQATAQPAILVAPAETVGLVALVVWAGMLVGGVLRRRSEA
jgi:hypothetical protein